MVTLPNAQSLGSPDVPRSQRGIVSFDGSAAAKGMINAGEQFQAVGAKASKIVDERQAEQDKFEAAQFMLGLKQAEADTQAYIANNPADYENFDKIKNENFTKAYDTGIKSVSNKARVPMLQLAAKESFIQHESQVRTAFASSRNKHSMAYVIDQNEASKARIAANPASFDTESALNEALVKNSSMDVDDKARLIAQNRRDLTQAKYDAMNPLDAYNDAKAKLAGGGGLGGVRNLNADTVKPYTAQRVAEIKSLVDAPSKFDALFEEMGAKYGVAPKELKLRAAVESGLNPTAQAKATPYGQSGGLMQLEAGTAKSLGVTDRNDPRQSVEGAAKLLAQHQKAAGGDQTKVDKLYYAGSESKMGPNTEQYAENLAAVRRGDLVRPDGTAKGTGFLGVLKGTGKNAGMDMTEYSVGVQIDGKEMDVPSLVPTLTDAEKKSVLNGDKLTPEIIKKAADHARMRISQGKPVFADNSESPVVMHREDTDVLQSVVKQNEVYLRRENAKRAQDDIAAAEMGIIAAPVMTVDDFLGDENEYDSYKIGVETGAKKHEYSLMPFSDIAKDIQQSKSSATGVNAADQKKSIDIREAAAREDFAKWKDDPAAMAITEGVYVKQLWDKANKPDSDPLQYQAALDAIKETQQMKGVNQIQLLPKSAADSVAAQLALDFKNREDKFALIMESKSKYGEHWPEVFKQIAPKLNDSIATSIIWADKNPEFAVTAANLSGTESAILEKGIQPTGSIPTPTVANIALMAQAQLVPLYSGMTLSDPINGGEAFSDLSNEIARVAMQYSRADNTSIDKGLEKAVKQVKESFTYASNGNGKTFLIPATVTKEPRQIERNAQHYIDVMLPKQLYVSDMQLDGLMPRGAKEVHDSVVSFGHWVTLPDETGVVLALDGFTVRDDKGAPITKTWEELNDFVPPQNLLDNPQVRMNYAKQKAPGAGTVADAEAALAEQEKQDELIRVRNNKALANKMNKPIGGK